MQPQGFEEMYAGAAPWTSAARSRRLSAWSKRARFAAACWMSAAERGKTRFSWPPRGIKPGASISCRSPSSGPKRKGPSGVSVNFSVADALELAKIGRQFDTVIDCGLFHTFDDGERPKFVGGLATVVCPGGWLHILCFSDK